MKEFAKMTLKMIVIFSTIFLVGYIIYFNFIYDMNKLPKGEYLTSLVSPNKKYKLNAYLYSGGATQDWTLRVELENVNNHNKDTFYWNHHENNVDMCWIDNKTVIINGKRLNVFKDKYDFRFN